MMRLHERRARERFEDRRDRGRARRLPPWVGTEIPFRWLSIEDRRENPIPHALASAMLDSYMRDYDG